MALPVTIPNTFANATASIPLSQLDTNFTTLANAVNGISDGSETLANASVTVLTAGTANVTTLNTSGQVVFNDAGADVDFRVESDTVDHALFVEGSSGNVGIGTSTPGYPLQVFTSSSINAATISMVNNSTTNISSLAFVQDGSNTASYSYIVGDGRSSGYLSFATNNAERMRIDSSGNVGIGVTSINATRKVEITQPSGYASGLRILSGGSGAYSEYFTGTANWSVGGANNLNALQFLGDGTERARITSGGNLTQFSSAGSDPFYPVSAEAAGTTRWLILGHHSASSTTSLGTSSFGVFTNGNVVNTNNSYGTLSDVKLKQDIVDAASQWDDLKAIRIRKFRFKNDPTGPLQIGLVAQELEEVSPGLVDEHPDTEEVEIPVIDDEGNPVLNEDGTPQVKTERRETGETTKSVKATILYMKAVKALQEAMERIETLEASNTALEARIAALENA